MMKRFLIAFSLSLTVLFLSSIAMAEPQVTISAGAWVMSGSMNVASAKGFFKDEGVDAKVVAYSGGKKAFKKFLEGETDFATCNLVGIVTTDFDISKYRLVATLSYTDNQVKLLARKSAGIKALSDLKGKKIGIVFGGNAHFYLYKLLTLNGITVDDVQLTYVRKKDMVDAIVNGKVDAICRNGLPIERAKKRLGNDWVQFEDDSIHRKSVHLVAPRNMVNRNPELIKGLLKGTLQADSFIQTNTEDAIKIIAKEKGHPLDLIDRAVRKEAEFNLSLRQSLLIQLEATEQWALENKLVKRTKPRNYLEFIDYKPLESVAPERVTLIR